jgi:hypothetical protein
MRKKQKKILFFSIIFLFLISGITISVRYIPINRIFKVSGTTETAFVNKQSINSEIPHALYFDFELDPKSSTNGSLYKGIAHSGHYSTKAYGENSYSFSVERKASNIGLENLGAVAMSAWVYVFPGKNDPVGNFVFAGSNGSINVVWKAITVNGQDVPRGKWFKISGMFDLSNVKFKSDTKLVVYFWNNSKTDILLDDFYIVFGGAKPRRGDSTLVDLSHGTSFTPKFNSPPYPIQLFTKEEINNKNSSFLIRNEKIKAGDISPNDRIYSGRFISDNRGTEDLLIINKTGNPELFSFCKDIKEFREITLLISTNLQSYFQSSNIINGYFSGNGEMQLILSGPKGLLVGEFERVSDACSGKAQAKFKILLNSTNNPLFTGITHLIAADVDNDKITEILATNADGSWKIYRLNKGKNVLFTMLASGNSDPQIQWGSNQNNCTITSGHFLQRYPQDLLLTVSKSKSNQGYSWSLLRFNPATQSFISCLNEKSILGRTIGRDTLKPSDQFLIGTFDHSGKARVFRYNRDWRYDLKEILFNDTTYQVIANIDFTGYEKDYNPKYFETLKLFPAMLVNSGVTSLVVIGKIHKKKELNGIDENSFIDSPALPNTIQVYSFKNVVK